MVNPPSGFVRFIKHATFQSSTIVLDDSVLISDIVGLNSEVEDSKSCIKTGSTTHWQADLASKEMAASDMRNRRHVYMSTNAAHPVSLDQEPLQGTISWAS
ncbi:hypothetical protein LAZ67_20001002 [Cordylochernes scorpioides]|uniref:Uncharacterized protein n=1 Tax=Cordylochernes scorpioides TaxID=51811 RepID=A0ABY6LL94_9ARAC|nr:hypothetical protein LAZ67_20001002 [Cordylochernes scorpioides]